MAVTPFQRRVFAVVRRIPAGRVMTYGEVAAKLGTGARAVGQALKKNFDPTVPCHRVIAAGGRLGGYNRGAAEKRRRLAREGYKS